jgi:hypothetical protein
MTLVSNQVPEAFDLDYKAELYGGSDSAKRALAGDVAALANTAGGLLVLGIGKMIKREPLLRRASLWQMPRSRVSGRPSRRMSCRFGPWMSCKSRTLPAQVSGC